MGPRGPLRASETQKAAFANTLKNICFLKVFGVERLPKMSIRDSRRLPRGTRRASRPQKTVLKTDPTQHIFWSIFGAVLGPQIGSKIG